MYTEPATIKEARSFCHLGVKPTGLQTQAHLADIPSNQTSWHTHTHARTHTSINYIIPVVPSSGLRASFHLGTLPFSPSDTEGQEKDSESRFTEKFSSISCTDTLSFVHFCMAVAVFYKNTFKDNWCFLVMLSAHIHANVHSNLPISLTATTSKLHH